ncbi:hypothetical protein Tco_0132542 [Tanacetum coccineum]
MWSFFHKKVYNGEVDRRKYHLEKLASNPKYEANYVLYGFVFPLKIWGLETFSNSIHWWRKDENVIPRGVAWSNGLKFEKSLLRSSTRGSSNSKSVHTRVWTEVCHEVHVRTEVRSFVHKEEVRTQALDQEDLLERVILEQIVKDQQQMIVDLQRRLLSVEQVTKKLRIGPSDVDHLDKNGNQYDNVPVGGLDHQSMDGVSQCMNNCNDVSDNFPVDGLDHQSMEGVSHCTSVDHISQTVKEVDESVAIDGLIRLRSQDIEHTSKESIIVDDNDFKVKDNEEAYFLSTQQVRDLMEEVFDDTPSGPDSTQDVGGTAPVGLDSDVGVSESMDVDQPSLDTVVKDVKTDVVPFQRQKYPGKACVSPYVQPSSTKVKYKKRRRVMKLDKPNILIRTLIGPDGNEITLLPWKEYEYPLYYADGVKYDVPWFAKSVKKLDITFGVITFYDSLGGPPSGVETRHFWLEVRKILEFQFPLYLDSVKVFEKKKIDKASYLISFRFMLSHNIPLEVDDSSTVALAWRERIIDFYWRYKILQDGNIVLLTIVVDLYWLFDL